MGMHAAAPDARVVVLSPCALCEGSAICLGSIGGERLVVSYSVTAERWMGHLNLRSGRYGKVFVLPKDCSRAAKRRAALYGSL